MKRQLMKRLSAVSLAAIMTITLLPVAAMAEHENIEATESRVDIMASGRYSNWDGVTNVAQFADANGNLCYAIDSDSEVTVYVTDETHKCVKTVNLKKQHPMFGTAICDKNGYFYLVTGEENSTDDTSVETVFISKYDSAGNHIKTTGDNGSSSLAYYYGTSFYTQEPFSAGNCDAAISGDVLTVNYARHMYSGHQSNSVFSVNINDMSKVNVGVFYESHSFAQRVAPIENGFVYMSEGVCFDRAFQAYCVTWADDELTYSNEEPVFDFWVEDGAYDTYNMYVVNENFAHMGGLATLSDGRVAFAAQSASSLDSNAASESEEIFIQIFDPLKELNTPEAYSTVGERSGLAGNNGRTEVTNYGVKWLTSEEDGSEISNVQIAVTENDEIVVLYELTKDYDYQGVYYIVLDKDGNVILPARRFSSEAMLNPCEMPVYENGAISWVGNNYGDNSCRIYIYSLNLSEDHRWNTNFSVDKSATCIDEGSESIHCSICDEIQEGSSRAIAKTAHTYGAWTIKTKPTYEEVGVKERKCKVCGHIEQAEIPVLEKKGWVPEDGTWYYYNADGTKATNTWKKDSKGWCWLQADGRMLTNGWAKDSKGWCWIDGNGYMLEQTKWIKVGDDWYHITNGYRDQSKWMKDSKGWCYLGKDGKMVTNGWAKDSKGWCWMGSDGYWVKNKWIKSGGYWYYLKSNGYMATGTLTISGKTYKFDSSGRWIS